MSAILAKIEGVGNLVAAKGKALIDSIFPPEKRAEVLAKLQQFALRNPKLSAFLLTNVVLTGPPLFLFILFTLTVLITSLIVALVVALLVAVAFTLFCVGVALLVLFPTVLFTTMTACFLLLWGLGGYYLFKWFNKGESPAPEGSALGDKLNSLTGGRLDFIMGPAREAEANGESKQKPASKSEKASVNGASNGPAAVSDTKKNVDVGKGADAVKKNATVGNATNKVDKTANVDSVANKAGVDGAAKQANLDGVTKQANLNGTKNKLGTTTGTVKGTVGGATGLS